MKDTVNRRPSTIPSAAVPTGFRSVLVPIDLGPISDRILGRLALLPLAEGARLTLLHVVPGNLTARARRNAESDARDALAAEVRHLSTSPPKAVRVEPVVAAGAVAKEIGAHATDAGAELIVMGRGGGRSLREAFIGSTAERVVRQAHLPVLVVRLRARGSYRRPCLALDLDHAADSVVRVMLRVLPPPRPRVVVVHAFDIPYEGLIYPSLSGDHADETREELQLRATQKLANLLGEALAEADVQPGGGPLWKMHVRYGSPRMVVEKVMKRHDTDLLVLGTRGYSGAAYVFMGTVAGRLLRAATCDVLVVPPARPPE